MSERAAREQLTERLRTVWPEPIPLGLTRLPRRSGRSEEYLVLPTMSRPVFLVPAASAGAAHALSRSDDGQRAPVLTRALQGAHQRGLLRRAPGVIRVAVPESEGLVASVRRLVPEADSVVVRLGRQRHGRAVVLQALDGEGRTLGFAKCARDSGIDRLRAERDRLHELAERPVPGVTSPPVLGWAEEGGAAVLCLGALTPGAATSGGDVPVTAMQALSARHQQSGPHPFGETTLLRRLQHDAEVLAARSPGAAWLTDHAARLAERYADQPVALGSWHGDWVPWNMARDGEEVLLWDWEHYEDDVLSGFDHIHFLAQTRRMREGTGPAEEAAWLAESRAALTSDWGQAEREAEVVIASYLLAVNQRYVADRVGSPSPTPDRAGWSHDLLARLLGASV